MSQPNYMSCRSYLKIQTTSVSCACRSQEVEKQSIKNISTLFFLYAEFSSCLSLFDYNIMPLNCQINTLTCLSPHPFYLCFRWYSWAVHRPIEAVWIWWLPPRGKLPFPGWLCGQRETIPGNHLPSACLQDQIPRELFPAQGQPWVCFHQPHLWVLRWV